MQCAKTIGTALILATLALANGALAIASSQTISIRDANGVLRTGHRALGEALGISATRAGQLLRQLAADGAIRVRASKTGSVITLAPRLVGGTASTVDSHYALAFPRSTATILPSLGGCRRGKPCVLF